ncbi:MAG: DUF11 domain-containing protein [Candidatus Roizmanbacteria bacterium]|nr:MAG: DUF11 domain-containing protein [Candidatus Roizmanbacteria bacterium]
MKAFNIIPNTVLIAIFILFTAAPAFAQYGQYGQLGYGGAAPIQSIIIDKTVGIPGTPTKGGVTTQDFVDNLSASDFRFKPGQEVMFRLKVKNTSSVKLSQVQVKDFLPSFVEALEGPGSVNNQTVAFNAGDFNSGEEKTFFIRTRLLAQEKLPADKGLFCLVNKAEAVTDNVRDEDTAQFCVEKEVVGVGAVPAAGPEAGLALFAFELLALGAGVAIKRLI